jgi:hypothetical protein
MLIAVASLQESFHHSCDASVPPNQANIAHAYALQQYNKALKFLTAPRAGEIAPEILLTCCALFAAFETFQNHPSTSTMQVYGGLKIIREHYSKVDGRRSMLAEDPIRDTLVPIFQQLGVDACAFSDDLPRQKGWFTDDCCIENDFAGTQLFLQPIRGS